MRNNIRGSIVATFVVVGALSSGVTLRAQGDPLIGRWMLNVAKSKFEGVPAPKSEIRVYEAFGGAGKGIAFMVAPHYQLAGETVTVALQRRVFHRRHREEQRSGQSSQLEPHRWFLSV